MAKITLSGNWSIPSSHSEYHEFTLSLQGNPSLKNDSRFVLISNIPESNINTEETFIFNTQLELFKFSEKIRGIPCSQWYEILSQIRGIDVKFNTNSFQNIYHENLLKSLFMIYYWLDLSLIEPSINQEELIYDQIILEYTGRPGKTNYLYCLPKNIVNNSKESLDELVKFNMLNKIDIDSHNKYLTFCVPVFESGVSVRLLSSSTQNIWKDIMLKTNYKIKKIFK